MKRYGQIYDKICTMENLYAAHMNARKDKLFYREVQMVDADPEYYLGMIQEMLLNESYEVSEYTVSIINDKGKERMVQSSMKDMGERFGSSTWAVPVILSGDTVYVHTDIEQVTVDANGNEVSDLFKYHEIQYGVQEYVELIGKENAELTKQVDVAQTQLTDTQLALCEVYEMIAELGV